MARKAQLYLVDYLAVVDQPPVSDHKGGWIQEKHNVRISVISRNLADVISYVCKSRHITAQDILAINRADEIELDDSLFGTSDIIAQIDKFFDAK